MEHLTLYNNISTLKKENLINSGMLTAEFFFKYLVLFTNYIRYTYITFTAVLPSCLIELYQLLI